MEECQKSYLDIPVDDYIMSTDFLLANGYKLNHVPKLNELIGPHEGRYMNLMRYDLKPVCLLNISHKKYWEEVILLRNYGVIPVSEEEIIVHLPTEEKRALQLLTLYKKPPGRRMWRYHGSFGYLLGYDATCIEAFYIRLDYILKGDKEKSDSDIFKSVDKFKQAKHEGVIPDYSTFVQEIIRDTEEELSESR
jgi:hypothetical protein